MMASAVHIAAPAGGGTDVLMEPFTNYTANVWVLASTPAISAAGRTGNAALFDSASDTATFTIPVASRSEWITVGFAWQHVTAAASQFNVFELYSDAGATRHNRLQVQPDKSLSFTRDITGIGSTATGLITTNATWYYIEVQARLHDSLGFVIIRLNGVEVLNATPRDTKNAGTNTVYESIRLMRAATGINSMYDDMYITTGEGATFKGAITIP
jgi:hypothetical protein